MLRNRLKSLMGIGLAAVFTVGSFSSVYVDVHAATAGYEPTITIHPHGIKNRAEFIARFTDVGMMFFGCIDGINRVYPLKGFFYHYHGRVFIDTNVTMEHRYHGSDVITARAQKVMLVDGVVSQPRRTATLPLQAATPPQTEQPLAIQAPNDREAPFLYTQSAITLPDRRLTASEMQAWIDEYLEMDGMSAFELELVRLTNLERVNHGLNALDICLDLSMASRFQAQTGIGSNARGNDISLHNTGPFGGSRNTAEAFGINDRRGANAFRNTWINAQEIVDWWMNSPGHRDNILREGISYIGVGSQLDTTPNHGVYHYQMFR